MKKRCLNCMKEYDEQYDVCPYCGFIDGTLPKELYHLHPGEILHRRYIVGTVVDYGGFGVIYRVWDAQMEQMVAIKEYFPSGLVNRAPGQKDVIVYSGKSKSIFENGLERYLMEARNMAAFSHPNIVNLYDFFEENNTAYIVMEFLDGISLKTYLAQNDGKLSYHETINITKAILNALDEIHSHNIIHRDISPDNIFLCSNERIKLIDFGAARFSNVEKEETRSIVLKPGFAPPEQYRSKSLQGPFTDLYALGACMYRSITGVMPEESLSRMLEDNLKEPKELVPDLPEHVNNTIMKAMALSPEYRFHNVREFQEALSGKKKVISLQKEVKKRQTKRKWILAAAVLVLLFGCAGGYYGIINHTRLIRVSNYSGKVDFYVPESQYDYFNKVKEDFEKNEDNQGDKIVLYPVDDMEYYQTVENKLAEKGKPAIYFSDQLGDFSLDKSEDLKSNVIDKMENLNESFYYLSEYYENGGDSRKIPMSFSVPFILQNADVAKALAAAPATLGECQAKKKSIANGVTNITINMEMQPQISGFAGETAYDSVLSPEGFNIFVKNKTAYYVTDWEDYKTLCTDSDFIGMKTEIIYPAENVEMNVDMCNTISISDEINIQEKMIAEDFLIYVLNSQANYLSDISDSVLPVNKKAMEAFADIWTINLKSSVTSDVGKTQFEKYLKNCTVLSDD